VAEYGRNDPEPELHRESSIPPESEWGTVDAWDKNTPLPADEVEVPFLKDIEFACGDGRVQCEDHNGFKLRFSKATLAEWEQTPMVLEFSASRPQVTAWSRSFPMALR
jgi:hypothetical protein